MFLSGGGAYAHVDARRTSVGGALDWALQAGLQGLVLEAGAVQAQPDAVASARSEGLLVRAGFAHVMDWVTTGRLACGRDSGAAGRRGVRAARGSWYERA